MPTFKHPCPHCGTYIQGDVVACPVCGTRDPFSPARCPQCSAVLEDANWIACPKCGAPVGRAAAAIAAQQAASANPAVAPGAVPGWGQGSGRPQAPGAVPGWGQLQTPVPPAPPTVAPAPVAPAPVAPARGVGGSACIACGSQLAPGAKFCRDCGTPVA